METEQANKYEAFRIKKVHRRKVKGAEYNPRRIKESARKRLKAFIKSPVFGLLEPLMWNEVTGNLVSGHQRLVILDALHRSDDYYMTMSVVRLNKKDEIQANVFMNNKSAQGHWDYDVLTQLGDLGFEFDYEKDFGFSSEEVGLIWGPPEEKLEQIKADADAAMEAMAAEQPKVEEEKAEPSEEQREEYREVKREARERAKQENANGVGYDHSKADYYLTVVFDCAEDKRDFMEALGKPRTEKRVMIDTLLDLFEKGL